MIDLFTVKPCITSIPTIVYLMEVEKPPEKQTKAERRAWAAQWRKKNRERINTYSREWMRRNRGK